MPIPLARPRRFVLSLLLLSAAPVLAQAEPDTGTVAPWVAIGRTVRVTLVPDSIETDAGAIPLQGVMVRGRLRSLDAREVVVDARLEDHYLPWRSIERVEVRFVERERRRLVGAAKGAGVGAGSGLLFWLLLGTIAGDSEFVDTIGATFTLQGAASGAVLGALFPGTFRRTYWLPLRGNTPAGRQAM